MISEAADPTLPRVSIERTAEGLEARLRPQGLGRFFGAAFLGVWLCGWAFGEVFALWLLYHGVRSLITGEPPSAGGAPLRGAPALGMGLFLLFWLSIWTLGGVMAMLEVLRLLWSEDRLVAAADLKIHRRLGPFVSTRTIPRSDLRRIYDLPHKSRLLAQTTGGVVELTALARSPERESLMAALRAELGLQEEVAQPGEVTPAAGLPDGWTEIIDAEGRPALVADPAIRRKQGRVAGIATAAVASFALLSISRALENPDWRVLAAVVSALAALLAWGSWSLTRTRREWRLGSGRLTLRRRSGARTKDLFEAVSLELIETSDSDGDRWFTLNAVAAGAPAHPPRSGLPDRKTRRVIARAMDDPTVPRSLGAWLARRTDLPYGDRATAESRKAELAAMVTQLEESGRLGRWLARRLPRP